MCVLHWFILFIVSLFLYACVEESSSQTCIWIEESGSIYAYFSNPSSYLQQEELENINEDELLLSVIFLSKNEMGQNSSTLKAVSVSDTLWLSRTKHQQNISSSHTLFQTSGFASFYKSDKRGVISYNTKKMQLVSFNLLNNWLMEPTDWSGRLVVVAVSPSNNIDVVQRAFENYNVIRTVSLNIYPEWLIAHDGINLQKQYFCF